MAFKRVPRFGSAEFHLSLSQNVADLEKAAELAEVSQLAVDESSEFDNFSYGKRKKRAISMSPA